MKALVFRGIGNIALETVAEPTSIDTHDVIVRLTRSAICGTDLHFIRGSISGIAQGTILGHEGVGVIEQIGSQVVKFRVGDRVLVPSTLACGECRYCLQELFSQCDAINPGGKHAGTVFFGGGGLQGMQTEKVRVPLADKNLVALPDDVSDDQAILLSDVFPTALQAIEMAQVQAGQTVAVFGCGPIGQAILACLPLYGVGALVAIDYEPSRLEKAKQQGAHHVIDFNAEDPVKKLRALTNGDGPECVIDAVGVDARMPDTSVWGYMKHFSKIRAFKEEVQAVAPHTNSNQGNWVPGNAPSQVLQWCVESVAKAGTISIIGVYPDAMRFFPVGAAMDKNLTIKAGICNHRKFIDYLVSLVQAGQIDPTNVITHVLPLDAVVDGYKHFDKRDNGWIKVVLAI